MTDPGGPFINTAVICERVLSEQDGVASAIRIIDRVFFVTDEHDDPIASQHPFTLFLNFKAGAARGSFKVAVRMEAPSGQQVPIIEAPVFFEGEERGVNLVGQVVFEPGEGAGLYWFDVLFEGERVTRIPLRVIYQSRPTTGSVG